MIAIPHHPSTYIFLILEPENSQNFWTKATASTGSTQAKEKAIKQDALREIVAADVEISSGLGSNVGGEGMARPEHHAEPGFFEAGNWWQVAQLSLQNAC